MSTSPADAAAPPLVSVIMAHHDAAPFLRAAIASVLCQTAGALELILSDDASTDESRAIATAAAARDPRIRVLRSERRAGPANARNRALDVARGDWIAIVDADDLIHPGRLERLIRRANSLGADVVADDLVYFGAESGRTLLGAMALDHPWIPGPAEFLAAETGWPAIHVGYLKPLIRRRALGDIRYRPYLTVGEDFDLLLRVLLADAKMAVLPDALYLYRRHPASISHRLSEDKLQGMLRAIDDLRHEMPQATDALSNLFAQRRRMFARNARFAQFVRRVKAGDRLPALRMLVGTPHLLAPLARSAGERIGRSLGPARSSPKARCFEITSGAPAFRVTPGFRRIDVPAMPAGWTARRVAALAAQTGAGDTHLRVHGHAGLEALGYVPGWETAEVIPPPDGWTAAEAGRIASLPWPVTIAANQPDAEPPGLLPDPMS